MEPSSLTSLCFFGADVGSSLVKLAKWVNGMPSTVKSLGFEIWASCEVLCELAAILARARRNSRTGFFNMDALDELEQCVETCDEVFHEAARAVLVAFERLEALNPKGTKVAKSKSSEDQIYLSFQEQVKWPLFQQRMKTMMEALMNAKMEIVAHILVFWTNWESESRRRSNSSLFTRINQKDRTSLINQLWNAKVRRDQEAANPKLMSLNVTPLSSTGSTTPSIFALSRSGSSSPLEHTSPTSTASSTSTKSSSSRLKRFGRKFKKSSRQALENIGFMTPKFEDEDNKSKPTNRPTLLKINTDLPSHSRDTSMTPAIGTSAFDNGAFSGALLPSLRRVKSAHPNVNSRPGLLSLVEATSSASSATQSGSTVISSAGSASLPGSNSFGRPVYLRNPSSTWSAGPTKSAKAGIQREWESLRNGHTFTKVDLPWNNEEGELGTSTEDPRELGQRLLFTQLSALIPFWAVADFEEEQATSDMLIERWILPGSVRRRVAQWEDLMAFPRVYEEPAVDETMSQRFHF